MHKRILLSRIIRATSIGIIFWLMAAIPVTASEKAPADTWQFNLMLYGWLPSVDGTLNYGDPGSGTGTSVDASTLIDDIQGLFMGAFEARRNKWSFYGDVVYLDMADENNTGVQVGIGSGTTLNVGTRTELTGWLTHLAGAYTVVATERGTLDILLGTRYFSIDTDLDLNITGPLPPTLPGRNLSRSTEILDGVIGVRGHMALIGNLYLPYHLDIGAGGSQFSWQAAAGLGYRFHWGSILLDYRHISFDQDGDELIDTFSLSGPALGVMFSF